MESLLNATPIKGDGDELVVDDFLSPSTSVAVRDAAVALDAAIDSEDPLSEKFRADSYRLFSEMEEDRMRWPVVMRIPQLTIAATRALQLCLVGDLSVKHFICPTLYGQLENVLSQFWRNHEAVANFIAAMVKLASHRVLTECEEVFAPPAPPHVS